MSKQFSEQDKEELLDNYMGILKHMAYKFQWLDSFDDLMSCAYIGFTIAINTYEEKAEDLDIPQMLFGDIKRVIVQEYFKSKSRTEESLNAQIPGEDNEGSELQDLLADDSFYYSESDIKRMVNQALFEWTPEYKELAFAYYFYGYSREYLQEHYRLDRFGLSSKIFSRLMRQSKAMIKRHLSNNDVISDDLLYPSVDKKRRKEVNTTVSDETYRRLKYLKQSNPILRVSDISNLLDCEPFTIQTILDYPTAYYIRCKPDDSIQGDVEVYIKIHYPETLPSEVTVYQIA